MMPAGPFHVRRGDRPIACQPLPRSTSWGLVFTPLESLALTLGISVPIHRGVACRTSFQVILAQTGLRGAA